MSKAKKLKDLLLRKEIAIAVGCYDGISARLVQETGFEVALLSGYGVSGTVLGAPDYGMITMTEMVTQARNVANILDIPLIGDGDTGYGNPLNVRRTVQRIRISRCSRYSARRSGISKTLWSHGRERSNTYIRALPKN